MVKMNKKLASFTALAIIMSIIMVPSIRVCAKNSITGSVKASSSAPSTGTVTEETTVEISPEVDAMSLEELIAHTEEMLKSSCNDDSNGGYNLRTYDDHIEIELWYAGMNEIAKLAVEDEKMYMPTWDYVVESMRDISETIYAPYKKYNKDVYVILLDDTNPEEQLAICMNGTVIYDFLHPER